MLIKLFIALAVVGIGWYTLYYAKKHFNYSPKMVLYIATAFVACAFLIRFGQPVLGAIVALLPFIQRALTGLMMYKQAKSIFNKSSKPNTNNKSKMSADQAREILGVSRHATKQEILNAHQKLIKKNHPDTGGSTFLASQINEARDVLLKQR